MAKEKKIPYSERNTNRVHRLLEKDPSGVKAVISNTVETKTLMSNIQTLDIIFNNARREVGHKVKIEDFVNLTDKFKTITDNIQELIEFAEEKNIYKKREYKQESSFSTHKENIKKLIDEDKTAKEIADLINEDLQKVEGWISTITSETEKPVADKKATSTPKK